jgi:hypothetical protein
MSYFKVILKGGEFVSGDGMWACNFRHPLRPNFAILPQSPISKYLSIRSSSSLDAKGLSKDQSQSIKIILFSS